MKLIDGLGQLGGALSKSKLKNITIYHKWNVFDKSVEAQQDSYNEFVRYVDGHKEERIMFISTKTEKEGPYLYWKRAAERYLCQNVNQMCIIRLPIIIGKGACQKFRDENAEPYGMMEIISLEDAVVLITKNANFAKQMVEIAGCWIPAKVVKQLIIYGKGY